MKRLLKQIAALRSMIVIARDPSRLDAVFSLHDAIEDPAVLEPMVARMRAGEATGRALRERARLGKVDLAALEALPEGTLGRAYANFMRAAGLDPASIPTLEARSEHQWFSAHLYETHDIWHVVTGFGPDVAGELGLQAFYLAQVEGPLSVAILAAGLVNTAVRAMEDSTRRFDEITRGWQLGRAARPLFGVRWGEQWARPLSEIRRELGLPAPPEAQALPKAA